MGTLRHAAVAAVGGLCAFAGVARANVIYEFRGNVANSNGATLTVDFNLTDAAAASGVVRIVGDNYATGRAVYTYGGDAFTSISIVLAGGNLGANSTKFLIDPINSEGSINTTLVLGPAGTVSSASFDYVFTDGDFRANFSGNSQSATGSLYIAFPGFCGLNYTCGLSGRIATPAALPEPVSMALLAGGLIPLAAVRRRRSS